MGILDDLAMGFGLKEKTKDYYDRTEQTLRRTQGDDRGDIYSRQTAGRRDNAPNYSNPIGPLRPDDAPLRQSMFNRNDGRDRDRSTFRNPQAGLIASFFGGGSRLGDQPMTPQRFLTNFIPGVGILRGIQRATGNQPYTMNTQSGVGPGTYQPKAPANVKKVAETPKPSAYSGLPADMEAQDSASPAPLLAAPDIQLEAFTGQPSDPMYMPGGEFDAFLEMTTGFPEFDEIRDDRDLMMQVFDKYKAMHRGKN
jgi:hypothetical protein